MTNKTPKLFNLILGVMCLFACSNANAQSVEPGKFRFGVGVDALAPVGNTSRTLNFGLGITPRLQYTVSERLALTFTSGIYHFFPKTVTYLPTGSFPGFTAKYKSDIIPVKLGAKVFIGSNFYMAGEVGGAFELADGGRRIHLLWSPAIGYAGKRLDVSARYESFSGNGYSDGVTALRVAYGFGL